MSAAEANAQWYQQGALLMGLLLVVLFLVVYFMWREKKLNISLLIAILLLVSSVLYVFVIFF